MRSKVATTHTTFTLFIPRIPKSRPRCQRGGTTFPLFLSIPNSFQVHPPFPIASTVGNYLLPLVGVSFLDLCRTLVRKSLVLFAIRHSPFAIRHSPFAFFCHLLLP